MKKSCPCCTDLNVVHFRCIANYDYFQCNNCKSLFIDTEYIRKIDAGLNIVSYESNYWMEELSSSKERSFGAALARMAEAFYYCRIPIERFIDIATGPGYTLDAIKKYLPSNSKKFFGIEKFPPPKEYQTTSENYVIGDLTDLDMKFDAGMSIEVIEHLTPNMLKDMLNKLANISNEQALYIFNSGLPDYVLYEDSNYLDPIKRGHIISYSIKAIDIIAKEYGFTTYPLVGKTWAFALEYLSHSKRGENIQDRIWSALPYNLISITDNEMGSVLKILGLETSRAYR